VLGLTVNAGQDLDENLYTGFGVFPSNLPEMQSLYFLAIDVQTAVGGQPLSALVLIRTYSRSPLPDNLEGRDDADYEESYKPRLIRCSTSGYACKRRCDSPCDCSIWEKIRKLKQVEEVKDDEDNEDDVDDEEANELRQSGGAVLLTNDGHARVSTSTECNSLEESDFLKMHAEDERRAQNSPCAQEHSTMLLTYKCPSGTTY
jgi:hypothetical protein